eukprot:6492446-Amphidinium_carterae.1
MSEHGGDNGGKFPPPPTWDGAPHGWRKFQQELKLWRLSVPPPTNYSAGARVAMGLTGSARRVAMTLSEEDLRRDPQDPWSSLNRLERALQQLVPASDTRTTQLLDKFFSTSLGERKQHESVNSFNSVFLTLLHHLQDEGINTSQLYIGYWYLRKMRISREQRERILQYAYAQADFTSTRRLLERARAQGRTGVRERGAVAAGLLGARGLSSVAESQEETAAEEVPILSSTHSEDGDMDFRFQASDVTVYNDLSLLMSVAVRLLPDIHTHERPSTYPKGTPKGTGKGNKNDSRSGKPRGVYLTDNPSSAASANDEPAEWLQVDPSESALEDEDMPQASDAWEADEEGYEMSHAEEVLHTLLAGELGGLEADEGVADAINYTLETLAVARKGSGKGSGRKPPPSGPGRGRGSGSGSSSQGSANYATSAAAKLAARKKTSTCRVCGRKGHWQGDASCPGIKGTPPPDSDVLVVNLGSLVSSTQHVARAVVIDTGSPHDLVGTKWLEEFRHVYPHAVREMPPLKEETTYCFGGQERDSTSRRVELTLSLGGQHVLRPVLSVLSGCANGLPALLGRASLEHERATVDCANRVLRFEGNRVEQPLSIDSVGHYVFEATGSFVLQEIGAGTGKEHVVRAKQSGRKGLNMFLVSLCQVLASTISLPKPPVVNSFMHSFGVQEPLRNGHNVLLSGNMRDIRCLESLDIYPQDVHAMLMSPRSDQIPDPEALEILVACSDSRSGMVLHYACETNQSARQLVKSQGHSWLHLSLESAGPQYMVEQHLYAGRVAMKECLQNQHKCLVFVNDKGVSRGMVSSILRSAVRFGHDIVLKTTGLAPWGKVANIAYGCDFSPMIRCPFVYAQDDCRLITTFPLLRDTGLLSDILMFLRDGMSECRRQAGVDDLLSRLQCLLSARRCIRKAPQRTNVPGARSVLLGAFGTRGSGITRVTHMYWKELPLIHALAALRIDPRPYMSISVNQGGVGWHVDKNNRDTHTDTISFGTFKGGLLESQAESAPLCTHHSWTRFNAQVPHRVQVTKGIRWSISLYSPKKTSGLSGRDMQTLRRLGFPACLSQDFIVALPVEHASKRRRVQGGSDSEYFYGMNSEEEQFDNDGDHPELTEFRYKGGSPDHLDDEEEEMGEQEEQHDAEQHASQTDHVPTIQEVSDMFKNWAEEDIGEHAGSEHEVLEDPSMEGVQVAGSLPDGRTFIDRTKDDLPPKEKSDEVYRAVRRLHRDLGHPPPHALARALALRGAREDVIRMAQEFRCSACEARRNPVSTPSAKLPSAFSFGDEVGIDTFKVYDSHGNQLVMLNCVDHFTGFQTTKALGKQAPTASAVWRAFVDSWITTLGKPRAIRVDNGAEFQGEFLDGCEAAGIIIKNNPRMYPQHNSIAERRGGFAKWVAQSALTESDFAWTFDSEDKPTSETHTFWAFLQHTVNNHINDSGFSAAQLALGAAQRLPLSLMSNRAQVEAASRAHTDGGFREQFWHLSCIRRAAASAQVNSRLGRVLASRPRSDASTEPIDIAPGLSPGSQCYVFHHPSPRRRGKRWWSQRWVGPGLVVATERQSAWVIYRRRLLKVAKTHIRPTTELEQVDWATLADVCFGRPGANAAGWHHPSASDVHRSRADDRDPFHLDEFLEFAGGDIDDDDGGNPGGDVPKRGRGRPRKQPPPDSDLPKRQRGRPRKEPPLPPPRSPEVEPRASSPPLTQEDSGPSESELVPQAGASVDQVSQATEGVQAPAPLMPEGHVDMIPEDPLDLLEPPGTYWDMSAPRFHGASDEVPDEPDPERVQNVPVDQGDQNVLVDGRPTRRINAKTSLRSRFSPYIAFLDCFGHDPQYEEMTHDACVVCHLVGKARSQELTWEQMSWEQREQFRPALILEWKTWTDFEAWRHPNEQENKSILDGSMQVIPTRWVLIQKTITTTHTKPKARLVAQ